MIAYCLQLDKDDKPVPFDSLREVAIEIFEYLRLRGARRNDKIDLKFNTKKIEILHERMSYFVMYLYLGTDYYCVFRDKLTLRERAEFVAELLKWFDVAVV